jgi:branched-chain amino acid transport system permease protein
MGARLVGIDVDRIFAVSFGIGLATLGAAACLLMPIFYVSPSSGHVFVIVAFTVVVLGGMGSFEGSIAGAALVGATSAALPWVIKPVVADLLVFVIAIIIVKFRPEGLLSKWRR